MEERNRDWLDGVLAEVQKPSRYIGGEWNQIVKDHREVDLTFALAFPDIYEIGMSHLGFRILYSLLNSREDTVAERVFCPWPDMAGLLRRDGRPLASVESGTPLLDFDVVGFSLQYEMTFTNVLEMLDLAGIPLRSSSRGEEHPLIAVGGPVVFNVEPLADFVDLVFVGDAEETLPEFLDRLKVLRRDRAPRAERIREAAGIEGIYAPSLYDVERDEINGLLVPVPRDGAPYPVRRRIVYDLDAHPFPDRIIVPHGEIVHDRVSVELMRGCPVGCRFCQAGYVYRPTRERDPNQVRDTVIRSVRATGYDSFSLSSLNTGEYGAIQPLMIDLMDRFEAERVSISLSSMHASTITPELAAQVRRVRKSGFTIAPEAGTQRLRNVINKNLSEEQILDACRLAYEAGWNVIKLYFMIGLPTETDADVDGIVDLAHAILAEGRKISGRRKKRELTVSASCFVPKPETPFQWIGMDSAESIDAKQDRIASALKRGARFRHHDSRTSFLEAVFSRGDRALGPVLERAWRAGARFDGWSEYFNWTAWNEAFSAEGVDPEVYAHRRLHTDGRLPWHVVDSRVNRKWLAIELQRALEASTLSVCGPDDCHGCAPFARECVKGVVADRTGRPLDAGLPLLSTPVAAGPGDPARAEDAPRIVPPEAEPVQPGDGRADSRPRYRYRVRFTKHGRMRYLGHLDLTRLLLRSLRRAGLNLVYSRGFNPKPKVSFGPALAVGVRSEGEYLDLETFDRVDTADLNRRVNAALPEGIGVEASREIRHDVPSLGEAIRAARYRVDASEPHDFESRLDAFDPRGDGRVVRTKPDGRSVEFNLAREILSLDRPGPATMSMVLALRQGAASVRPEEVLGKILGPSAARARIVREELLVDWKGRLVNPLLAASASEARAE